MPDQDHFDRLLDSALSNYAAPAPDFEDRILRSVIAAERVQQVLRRSWLRWATAIPAAACLLIVLGLTLRNLERRNNTMQQVHQAPAAPMVRQPETAAAWPAPVEARLHRTQSAAPGAPASVAALPKRDVFPTPHPLTPAEQAFVKYVSSAPEKDRQALVETQAQQKAPIQISAIEIQPITTPALAGSQGEP